MQEHGVVQKGAVKLGVFGVFEGNKFALSCEHCHHFDEVFLWQRVGSAGFVGHGVETDHLA
eukprot:2398765-Ditylum_brightwellii.AAC.1